MFNRYFSLIVMLFFTLLSCEPTTSSQTPDNTQSLNVSISYSNTQQSNLYAFDVIIVGSNQIVGYEWEIDDIRFYTAKPSYTFQNAGNYLISLKVTDSNGKTDTDIQTITVTMPQLEPQLQADLSASNIVEGVVPYAATLNAANSTSDFNMTSYQ
ncbi:MAG: hypothetical protein HRU38_21325, partial [Saccharospirillaceae bacterium]|nr:PKD domain-containing protein [Pseudomonadales bacterium]NRB81171.1 hypothetical protein [Saccharospirillaceae bacterium]